MSIQVDSTISVGATAQEDPALEALVRLFNQYKLTQLEEKARAELGKAQELHKKIQFLHQLLSALNTLTDSKGALDLSQNPDLSQMLTDAQGMGVDLDPAKVTYTKDERDRLLANIDMTVKDNSTLFSMQEQMVRRVESEQQMVFQIAMNIMKPLHDAKVRMMQQRG